MKKKIYPFILIILATLFFSCEDVVDIDVPEGEPRLIIDAIVRVDTTEAFTEVRVIVKETNSFFESLPPLYWIRLHFLM